MDEKEKVIGNYSAYAKKSGFRLNPDKGVVGMIVAGLLENQGKFGARYCPCRIRTGKPEEDRKIICPCAFHRSELREAGRCHCGLFVK